MIIRDASHTDLPGILAIYNEVIVNSTAIYALGPVTLEDRAAWRRPVRRDNTRSSPRWRGMRCPVSHLMAT